MATTSVPACGMEGMDVGNGRAGSHKPDSPHKTCEFCAVAGHVPVCGSQVQLAPPSAVAWLNWRAPATLGPRGPPAIEGRARGPPAAPPIA